MRRLLPVLVVLAAVAAVAGCGSDGSGDGGKASTATSTVGAGPTTTATTGGTTTSGGSGGDFVVVTSLLGRDLPKEPGCTFADAFMPDKPSASAYDGALTLTVTCKKRGEFAPVGQIVNRAGRKPTEITCRDSGDGQSFCVYVPSETVALTFIAADQDAARRRLQRLIDAVQPLPTGVSPLSGASSG